MASSKYYYYDEQRCEFVPVSYSNLQQLVYTVCSWVLCSIVLTGIGISILSFSIGTPSEVALKAENQELVKQLENTKSTISSLNQRVGQLAKVDNKMYRSILGMDPISYDERKAGSGGADIYSKYDVYSQHTSDILKQTAEKLESLKRSIKIQHSSFEEIQRSYNKNQKKMKHIPAIKPTGGIVLSGFGMRYHPILNYRRMHEGLDFRAQIGTKVYATGDGVVKYSKRKGTFGRLLIIDNGYGYETYFAHLSSFAKGIRPGTKVKRGQLVAFSGATGMAEGPHLHYEVHKEGEAVNPINYLFADTSPQEYKLYKNIIEANHKSMD